MVRFCSLPRSPINDAWNSRDLAPSLLTNFLFFSVSTHHVAQNFSLQRSALLPILAGPTRLFTAASRPLPPIL